MRRGLAIVVGASGAIAMAVACSSFEGGAGPDVALDGGSDRDVVVPVGGEGGAVGDAGAEATTPATPFCDRVGGGFGERICTDFEPTANVARQWEKVLDTSEVKGVGDIPFLYSEPNHANVYVARMRSDAGANGQFGVSRGSHHNTDAGWNGGIPARKFQMMINVATADPNHPIGIFGWEGDDVTAHAIVLACRDAAVATCTLEAWRGLAEKKPLKATIKKREWTRLVISLPPVTYDTSGNDQAPNVTVTTQVAPAAAIGNTVDFGTTSPAPRRFRADIGIVALDTQPVDSEVWYDDLTLTY